MTRIKPLNIGELGLSLNEAWKMVERRETQLMVWLDIPRRHRWEDVGRAVVMLNDRLNKPRSTYSPKE